jgi:hypothetical protein
VRDPRLSLVDRVASILDDLEIPYVPGGSLASTLVGEPRDDQRRRHCRSCAAGSGRGALPRTSAEFYVQTSDARDALRTGDSFNLVDHERTLKVDLFVLGDGLLDRMQIERRVPIDVPGLSGTLWVTSPEDQVLRKLDWFRQSESDRQWRDVVAILRIRHGNLDSQYLTATAREVGLDELSQFTVPSSS